MKGGLGRDASPLLTALSRTSVRCIDCRDSAHSAFRMNKRSGKIKWVKRCPLAQHKWFRWPTESIPNPSALEWLPQQVCYACFSALRQAGLWERGGLLCSTQLFIIAKLLKQTWPARQELSSQCENNSNVPFRIGLRQLSASIKVFSHLLALTTTVLPHFIHKSPLLFFLLAICSAVPTTEDFYPHVHIHIFPSL